MGSWGLRVRWPISLASTKRRGQKIHSFWCGNEGKWEALRTNSSDQKRANEETPGLLQGVFLLQKKAGLIAILRQCHHQIQSSNFLQSIKNGRQRSAPNLN